MICLRVGIVLIFQHAAKHKSYFYYYHSYLLNMYTLSLLSLSGFLKYNFSQNYSIYLHFFPFILLIVASWVKKLACHHSAAVTESHVCEVWVEWIISTTTSTTNLFHSNWSVVGIFTTVAMALEHSCSKEKQR